MAKGDAIGQAAVVLTANADGLVNGFQQAVGAVERGGAQIGASLKKADAAAAGGSGGKGGGFFSSLLTGGVAGAVAGGVGLLAKLPGMVRGIPDAAKGLAGAAGPGTFGGLAAAGDGVSRIFEGVERLAGRLLSQLGPAFTVIADVFGGLFDRMGPKVDAAGEALGAYWATLGELAGVAVEAVLDGVDAVGRWAAEFLGLDATTTDVTGRMFAALRVVGQGVAYVWDTLKAGIGVMALVGGYIVDGFGQIVNAAGGAMKAMAELAQNLPDMLRPAWVDRLAETGDRWGEGISRAGDGMKQWGRDALASWGTSAAAVDQWFNGVEARYAAARKQAAAMNDTIMAPYKMSAAFMKGSAEAVSVVAKYNASGGATDRQAKLLERQAEANRILGRIEANTRGGDKLTVR